MKDSLNELADADREDEFKPLSAQEAAAWRARHPGLSPWRVLAMQAAVGAMVVLVAWLLSGEVSLAASVAWGVVSVWLPALVFARALARQMRQPRAGSALVGLFVWEGVKVALTVALLLVAPQVVAELNWLALLAGFVLTMKMYWLAMVLHTRRR